MEVGLALDELRHHYGQNWLFRQGILFLALVLFSWGLWIALTIQDQNPEWMRYQKEYYSKQAEWEKDRIKSAALLRTRPKIEQIFNKETGMVDRCITCHSAYSDPRFASLPQPFRSHTERIAENHPFDRFGCTTCHFGQARATVTKQAHGNVKFWGEPMLPLKSIQASCGRCHEPKPLAGAEEYLKGRHLFIERGCVACHSVTGLTVPSWVTPDLEGIGSKTTPEWLFLWTRNPNQYLKKARMPKVTLTDKEAGALTAFLMTSKRKIPKEPDPTPEELKALEGRTLIEYGEKRYREMRCVSCHSIAGKGGTLASDLGGIGVKVNREWLEYYIRNTHKVQPGSRMPWYRLTNIEVKAVGDYLMDAGTEYEPDEEALGRLREIMQSADYDPDKGKELFTKVGCNSCHRIGNIERRREFGPHLDGFGSKSEIELDYGKRRGEEKGLPHFIERKLKDSRYFSDDASMPEFSLSDDEIHLLVVYLLSLTKRDVPKELLPKSSSKEYVLTGQVGELFKRYSCLSCHSIGGSGGTMAPDFEGMGSKLKQEFVRSYLLTPYAVYPVMTERMPQLNLTDQESQLFADYLRLALLDDKVESVNLPQQFSPDSVKDGRLLFWETYRCDACHIAEGKGGYYGPSLDSSGLRLSPKWIYLRMTDLEAVDEFSREPNFKMNPDEAKAVTAYLMSLKKSSVAEE